MEIDILYNALPLNKINETNIDQYYSTCVNAVQANNIERQNYFVKLVPILQNLIEYQIYELLDISAPVYPVVRKYQYCEYRIILHVPSHTGYARSSFMVNAPLFIADLHKQMK